MPLTICPSCSRETTDRRENCVYCGADLFRPQPARQEVQTPRPNGVIAPKPEDSISPAEPWRRLAIAMHVLAFAFLGTLYALFAASPAPSLRGITGWLAMGVGVSMVPLTLGLVGCLYKPNRTIGYIFVSWIVFLFILSGLLRT